MHGYPGQGWHRHHHGWGRGWGGPPMMRGWHGPRHFGPFGFFMILPGLFLMGFLFFGLMKFLWPLLAIGLIVLGLKMVMGGGPSRWNRDNRGGWDGSKRKNDWQDWDEKSKRKNSDDRRYSQTEDGEWVEIV